MKAKIHSSEFIDFYNSRTMSYRKSFFDIQKPGYSPPEAVDYDCNRMPGPGENNWVLAPSSCTGQFNFDLGENCTNNLVILSAANKCKGRILIRGSNSTAVIIGSAIQRSFINIHMHSSNHFFYFGHSSTANNSTFEMGTDGTSCIIGEDCMFSSFIDVTTDDMHALIDVETGIHLNPASDVIFQPHVWVGMHSTILKGVTIGFGSIIGSRSVVSQSVPKLVSVAGIPAQIKRTGVSWVRDRVPNVNSRNSILDLERQYSILSND